MLLPHFDLILPNFHWVHVDTDQVRIIGVTGPANLVRSVVDMPQSHEGKSSAPEVARDRRPDGVEQARIGPGNERAWL